MTKTKQLDYGADSPDAPTGSGELSQITRLALRLLEAEARVADAQHQLETATKARDHIARDLLPTAMDACGQEFIGLPGNKRLQLKRVVSASIPEAHSIEALAWLRKNGYGRLIKHFVSVVFGMGQDNLAKAFYAECMERKLEPSQKINVHPSTLTSFVKTRLEAGQDVPSDLFGVFDYRKAEIVEDKAKAKRQARRTAADE